MIRIPEVRWKFPIPKQLAPRCAFPECTASRGWSGVLHRVAGFRLNGNDWYCSAECLEAALEEQLLDLFFDSQRPAPVRTNMPLGLAMLSRGVITDSQLRDGLELQHSSGVRIGACLQRLGLVTADEIAAVVATQWGCPLFPGESVQAGCSMLMPFSLIERYRMAPVHLVGQGRRLFVAFCDRVNHTLLIAMEQILGCQAEACIIPETKLQEVIEFRKNDTTGEVAMGRPAAPAEVARMVLSYAHQTGSTDIRLHGIDGNLWLRFISPRTHLDLVFEMNGR